MKNKPTVGILITTMNDWINRVKKELLPQLKDADEIIISHQITDKNIKPEQKNSFGEKIKYYYMFDKWLSKNRNNALKHATADICYICDDDLNFVKWFVDIIKNEYIKHKNYDIITFQAKDEKWKLRFFVKEGKHSIFSICKISSLWITFKRKSILEKWIKFDENFGLGAKYIVWEENIFLRDAQKKWLKLYHSNKVIVIHPSESSGINYENNEKLVVSRIKLFKRMYWFIWGLFAIPYFTILHYKYYKNKISIWKFLILSFKGLI